MPPITWPIISRIFTFSSCRISRASNMPAGAGMTRRRTGSRRSEGVAANEALQARRRLLEIMGILAANGRIVRLSAGRNDLRRRSWAKGATRRNRTTTFAAFLKPRSSRRRSMRRSPSTPESWSAFAKGRRRRRFRRFLPHRAGARSRKSRPRRQSIDELWRISR